jgi:hypothetical protein
MRIILNIPDAAAAILDAVSERDGITPTQWVTRAVQRALPETVKYPGRPRVNEARDAEMRAKRAAGATQAELAREYGLNRVRVQQICDGRDSAV